jgi:hypothetical protein
MTTKIPMTLRRWYGTSVSLPSFGSWRYADFAISCLGIVSSLVEEKFGKKIRVGFMKGGTAHADWDNLLITINESFLKGNFGPKLPKMNSEETLSVLMGIETHEAAHFAWSPKTGEPWVSYIKEHSKCAFQQDIAMAIGNIVEDIYIEAEVDRQCPSLSWTLESLNELFFSSFSETETLQEAVHIESAPENLADVSSALNVLIFAKTRQEVATSPFLVALFATAREATEASHLSLRTELSLAIYNALMEKITQEECDNAGGEGEVKEAIGKMKERSEGLTSSPEGRKKEVAEPTDKEAEKIEEFLNNILEHSLTFSPQESFGKTSLYLDVNLEASGEVVTTDRRYAPLAEIARQRASVNRPYGLDRNRGHSIRKLYRIGTDSKIFAEPVSMSTYKPMDVIILVDCSGSMITAGSTKGTSRIDEACQAALGAASALAEARCQVAVFGHTADKYTDNEVDILNFKNFNEPISILPFRLGALTHAWLRENRDGYAISYVAKRFNRSSRRKLLIVISDGHPAACEYMGSPAIRHTKDEVDKVRKQEIDVLSISISEDANRANEVIYGKGKNVYHNDPNIIADIVRSLITN